MGNIFFTVFINIC